MMDIIVVQGGPPHSAPANYAKVFLITYQTLCISPEPYFAAFFNKSLPSTRRLPVAITKMLMIAE